MQSGFDIQLIHDSLSSVPGKVDRHAVRAVIRRDDLFLMIHSPVNGDCKFPGGGVEDGEDDRQALRREVHEESGYSLASVDSHLGRAVQVNPDINDPSTVFSMESRYYSCRLSSEKPEVQNLDDYEDELGFRPVWISAQNALGMNETVLAGGDAPAWTERDTRVLRILAGEEKD